MPSSSFPELSQHNLVLREEMTNGMLNLLVGSNWRISSEYDEEEAELVPNEQFIEENKDTQAAVIIYWLVLS